MRLDRPMESLHPGTDRDHHRSAPYVPSAASSFALQQARELREERAVQNAQLACSKPRQERYREEDERQKRATECFPLSGFAVNDGYVYGGTNFQLQLDIASRDRFLEVLELPPLYESYQVRFAMAETSVSQLLARISDGRPFKLGITRGPSARFHNVEGGRGVGPRGGFKGYCDEGYDRMAVVFCGSPNACAELERRLIAVHRPNRCCQNTADGGEGKAAAGVPSFLYIVWADLGNFADLETKARFRSSSLKSENILLLCQARDLQEAGSAAAGYPAPRCVG